jgi:hypothetical protein
MDLGNMSEDSQKKLLVDAIGATDKVSQPNG